MTTVSQQIKMERLSNLIQAVLIRAIIIIENMMKIVKKKQLIINIQNRQNKLEKKRYTTIAEEFHISFLTAKKYVMMSEKEIQSMDSLKKDEQQLMIIST